MPASLPAALAAFWGTRISYSTDLENLKVRVNDPAGDVLGWTIDSAAMAEIDRIVAEHVRTPIDPDFMAPPVRAAA